MPEREALAKNLKEFRRTQKETQFEFAANIGISIEELSRLERQLANPNLDTLQKIAAYTGDTVRDLLQEKHDKNELEPIYQHLINKFFLSEDYAKIETDEDYMRLTSWLVENLQRESFLECEELLNTAMISRTEKVFIAGYFFSE